jgi:hypothetical protein
MTKSEANPSIKVNKGVLWVNVQSQGLSKIRWVQDEGVESVVKAFNTETKITGIISTWKKLIRDGNHHNRERRNPSRNEDKQK